MIACEDPAVLNEFEQLLNNLAGSAGSGGPELTIFYLKYAKVEPVKETLEKVFTGDTTSTTFPYGGTSSYGSTSSGGLLGSMAGAAFGDGGGILGSLLGAGDSSTITPTGILKITADTRLNALIVQANATDVATIEQLLKILDQKESPEEVLAVPKARIIPLENMQADEVADIVRQVYQDRMAGGIGGMPGMPGQMPSPQDLIAMFRGGGRGGRGGSGGMSGMGGRGGMGGPGGGRRGQGQSEEVQKMTIGVDNRTNSVILSAPEPLFSEVSQLIQQLDEGALAESTQAMRVVTLHKASSNTVQQALAAIVGGAVQFGSTGGMGPGGPAGMQGGRYGQQGMGQMYGMRGTRGGNMGGGGYMPGGGYGSYGSTGGYGSSRRGSMGGSGATGGSPGGYGSGRGGAMGGYSAGGYPGGGYGGGRGGAMGGGYPGGSGRGGAMGGFPGGSGRGGFSGGGMGGMGGGMGGGMPSGGGGRSSGGGGRSSRGGR